MGDQIVVPETARYGVASAAAAGFANFAANYGVQTTQGLFNSLGERIVQRGFQSGRTQTSLGRKIGPMPVTGVKRKFGYGLVARTNARSNFVGSTFTGRFRGPRRSNKKSIVATKGYRLESELKGSVTDATCVRLGVAAYPVDQMLVAVWIAVLRYMFKKVANLEFYDVNQFIEANNVINGVSIEWQEITSKTQVSAQGQSFLVSAGLSTLKSLAEEIARFDLNLRSTTKKLPYRMFIETNAALGGPGAPTTFLGVVSGQWFRIDKLLISVYGKAEVNIQNTTYSNTNVDSTTSVSVAPLTGNIIFGSGQTICSNIRGRTNANTANDNDFPFAYEGHGNGVIVAGAAASGTWRAVQPASQFNFAKKQKAIELQPGESKVEYIGYKWKGYLSTFLDAYFKEAVLNTAISPAVTDPPVHAGHDDGRPGLNRWLLIQLEKRIDVSSNPSRMWYQVDFHLGARVVKGVKPLSMNVDYRQEIKNSNV